MKMHVYRPLPGPWKGTREGERQDEKGMRERERERERDDGPKRNVEFVRTSSLILAVL